MRPVCARRVIGSFAASVVACTVVLLAAQTPPPLDARASDPVTMGWMTGDPVPPERVIRFADSSFFRFPQTRWSFSHLRQLMPTSVVRRGRGPVSVLPRAERSDIDGVTFTPIGGAAPMTWADSLLANYTDGILVLHRGRIVQERYFGILRPERQHIAFSVTKSFVAMLARTLIAEGKIGEHDVVSKYLPEMASSGLGDATIRQLLDMTTGPDYTEVYGDPNSSVRHMSIAVGFFPRPSDYRGPNTIFEYLGTITKAYPHGEQFKYKTINTDMLQAVVRRVTGQPLSALMEERIFGPLGAEEDGFFTVDPSGVEFAGGGFNLTLRDMARFGEMMRLGGRFNGRQVVPEAVVADVRRGANRDHFVGAGYATLPGWSYRNMWWVSHNAHGAYMARGIHGQAIYIDPAAEMVIARFASHHIAGNVGIDPTSLPAYEALASHLMAAGR